ncbi:DUF262 domain-containing protein [Pseudomonas aeruginosa]
MANEHNPVRAKNEELAGLVNPAPTRAHVEDVGFANIPAALKRMGDERGGLNLTPDFQRGHVWTREQQIAYLENVVRGVVPKSGRVLKFNCPNFTEVIPQPTELPPGLECIDGLQRYTAIVQFLAGDFELFNTPREVFKGSSYMISSTSFPFQIEIFSFHTRAEVIKYYLDHNTGGTPHSAEELERVRELYKQVTQGAGK